MGVPRSEPRQKGARRNEHPLVRIRSRFAIFNYKLVSRDCLFSSCSSWTAGYLLFDNHDIDLVVLSITRLVAKIKNAGRKAKPFSTLVERPDAVAFRQQVHQPLNQMIDPAGVFRTVTNVAFIRAIAWVGPFACS